MQRSKSISTSETICKRAIPRLPGGPILQANRDLTATPVDANRDAEVYPPRIRHSQNRPRVKLSSAVIEPPIREPGIIG